MKYDYILAFLAFCIPWDCNKNSLQSWKVLNRYYNWVATVSRPVIGVHRPQPVAEPAAAACWVRPGAGLRPPGTSPPSPGDGGLVQLGALQLGPAARAPLIVSTAKRLQMFPQRNVFKRSPVKSFHKVPLILFHNSRPNRQNHYFFCLGHMLLNLNGHLTSCYKFVGYIA